MCRVPRLAQEVSAGSDLTALGGPSSVVIALLQPIGSLAIVQDHLVAIGLTLREPRTLVSMLTLMRTAVVASSQCAYLTDPVVDVRERVRRGVNYQLESTYELLRYFQGQEPGHQGATRTQQDLLDRSAADGFTTNTKNRRPPYLEPDAPGEMERVRLVLGQVENRQIGDDVYRLLSASAHAQPHALHMLVDPTMSAEPSELGYTTIRLSMTTERMLDWLVAVIGSLHVAFRHACGLYGWDPLRWNSVGQANLNGWIQQAG